MKIGLAVTVCCFNAAAHIGATVETLTRTFDLPPEVAKFIADSKGQWSTVSLSIHEQQEAAGE
jgi:hypothetical protein